MNRTPADTLRWEVSVPLVTDRRNLVAMATVSLGAGALVGALVALLLAVQGDWSLVLPVLSAFMLAGAAFFVLALGLMALLFGNRMHVRYTLTPQHLRCESLDRVARATHRAALVVGLLAGRPGAAGSALLAMTQEDQRLRWDGAFVAVPDPRRHTIVLRNRWRTLMAVRCSPDNYGAVEAAIHRAMAAHGTAGRSQGASPLPACLRRTAFTVLATLPLLLVADGNADDTLWLPFVLMCLAIASLWFVRPLAWAALGVAALLATRLLAGLFEQRHSTYRPGSVFPRHEVLSGDDWALLALATAGLAYLAGTAVRILRRRVQPLLESDLHDAGEG